MGDRTRPALFNIPAHRAFSDALVTGILAQHGGDPMQLAQGMILLPSNRAARTVSDAFVRKSGGGLLLPRLVTLGDPDLGEQVGGALDPLEEGEAIPSAIPPMRRAVGSWTTPRGVSRVVGATRDSNASPGLYVVSRILNGS